MTHITGIEYGFKLVNWQIGDHVVDVDTGNVNRIVADGGKGASFWPAGNIYRPATDGTAQAIVADVAAQIEALVPRCN